MSSPRCPNHAVPLSKCQVSKGKGVGICPISGWHFSFEVETEENQSEMKIDKFGRPYHDFKVAQIDGGTGG